jgi:hypothetical protein
VWRLALCPLLLFASTEIVGASSLCAVGINEREREREREGGREKLSDVCVYVDARVC